ncbi:M28 family peptidase [Candidatus Bathyarchaeota archaeon]|nr:M28 family peptidase [Candidatus Bathyarchaeota archaeon]
MVDRKMLLTSILFFVFFHFITINLVSSQNYQASYSNVDLSGLSSFINSLNFTAVKSHLRFFSELGTRVTGYEGCDLAAEYIRDYWNNLGLNVTVQEFNVTVPVDYGGVLIVPETGDVFNLSGVEPNLVALSTTPGIDGQLIYVPGADMDFEAFDGKPLNGSIVLMDYNSGQKWLYAVKFGAKAVIFIEPEWTTYTESSLKSINVNLQLPRYYIKKEDAYRLIHLLKNSKEPLQVHLESRMRWERRVGRNIIALLPGETDQIVVLSAHYDSYSVVPSVAPGANDAVGISTLLELSRVLSYREPMKYSVMFVAFAGHYQGIKGARIWVNDTYFGENKELSEKILLQLNIQVSSLSNTLFITNIGQYYFCTNWRAYHLGAIEPRRFEPFFQYFVQTLSREVSVSLGKEIKVLQGGYTLDIFASFTVESTHPLAGQREMNDAEPLAIILGPGFCIRTVDEEEYLLSPIDTYERLNIPNLKKNFISVSALIYGVLMTQNLQEYVADLSKAVNPANTMEPTKVVGQVAIYDERIADYRGISALVCYGRTAGEGQYPTGFPLEIISTDEDGRFEVPLFGCGRGPSVLDFIMYAYRVNDTTGEIVYAPDFGTYQWAKVMTKLEGLGKLLAPVTDIGYYTIHPSASIVIFDTFYPFILGTHRGVETTYRRSLDVVNAYTLTTPDFHSERLVELPSGSLAIAYVSPEESVDILLKAEVMGLFPLGILTNASTSNPEGYGYRLRAGEQLVIYGPLNFAIDTSHLVETHLSKLKEAGLFTLEKELAEKNMEVKTLINNALKALREYRYMDAVAYSLKAWSSSVKTYVATRKLIVDISQTTVFFGFVTLPFTFFLEKVLFDMKGRKKILSLLCIYTATILIFSLLHPSFHIASNPLMIVVGISALFLIIPMVGICFSWLSASLRRAEIKVKGIHEAPLSIWSVLTTSFQIGIENMKRRKMRSSLALTTIVLVVVGVVLFSSVSAISEVKPSTVETMTLYKGVYIRDPEWATSLNPNLFVMLKSMCPENAKISMRAWIYPTGAASSVYVPGINVTGLNGEPYNFYAIVGVTPDDWVFKLYPLVIIKGRSFIESDVFTCIIPDTATAPPYNLSVGDVVRIDSFNQNFTIIGIFNSSIADWIYELDGEPALTPFDKTIPEQYYMHRPSVDILFIPYKTAISLGGSSLYRLASISILTDNTTLAERIAKDVFTYFDKVNIMQSTENAVNYYATALRLTFFGWQMQIIPLALAGLILLNIGLGNIKEREREILIYSSIGLSPLHVGMMFLFEMLVKAILGAVIGYAVALSIGNLARIFVGEAIANPSSSWVIITILVTIGLSILSSVYSLLKASKLVTPSLERKWRIPTKPLGDLWSIPLPFVILDKREALGLTAYLKEIFETHVGEAEVYSIKSPVVVKEEKDLIRLKTDVQLEPYERGITQTVEVIFNKPPEMENWATQVILKRLSGSREEWSRLNRRFLDAIRKQFLMWRSLQPNVKKQYMGR